MYDGTVVSKKKESIAIIDLGYNSVKVSAYDIYKNGYYKKKFQRQEYVQIGLDLNKNNHLISNQNIERTSQALLSFKEDLKTQDIDSVIPIATSAVRDAENQKEVINNLHDRTGICFNILSGPEEGFFTYIGSQSYMHVPNGVFFDLGGGSMELMHIQDFKIQKTICLDLGVLRLSQEFIKFHENYYSDQVKLKNTYDKLEKSIIKYLPNRNQFRFDEPLDLKMVAIGGTARSIYKFISKIFFLDSRLSSHHVSLEKRMIDIANNIFREMSVDEISNLRFVDPQRSRTITTGSIIIKILMEKYNFNNVLISPTGVREGILEHYLYFRMDKKYRKRKKFIEANCEPLTVIAKDTSRIPSKNSSTISLDAKLTNFDSFTFPRRLERIKVSKLTAG